MTEFRFPDVGEGLTEATLVEWTVETGQTVEEDDTVAHVETDKAVVDIPSPESGTVTELKAEAGDTIKVGEVIMTLHHEAEALDKEPATKQDVKTENTVEPEHKDTKDMNRENTVLAMPRVRQKAHKENIDLTTVTPSGNHGQILLRDLKGDHKTKPVPEPAAQNLEKKQSDSKDQKQQKNQTIKQYKPTDSEFKAPPSQRGNVKSAESSQHEQTDQKSSSVKPPTSSTQKISGVRKAIASKMQESLKSTAQFTVTEDVDVTHIVELRDGIKSSNGDAPSYLAFFAKAAILGLKDYPKLNATFEDDTVTSYQEVNLGVAVNTKEGLYVPVIHGADKYSISAIGTSIQNLAEQVRNGSVTPTKMQGGTFTISSLGILGGQYFTPILNTPEVAILGIGELREKPWIVDGDIQPRKILPLSLTVNHQVIDGADAAKYLKDVKNILEHSEEMMIR